MFTHVGEVFNFGKLLRSDIWLAHLSRVYKNSVFRNTGMKHCWLKITGISLWFLAIYVLALLLDLKNLCGQQERKNAALKWNIEQPKFPILTVFVKFISEENYLFCSKIMKGCRDVTEWWNWRCIVKGCVLSEWNNGGFNEHVENSLGK